LLAVETNHGVIRLVDPDSGREFARLEDPNQERAHRICFSSDGAQLVAPSQDSRSIHVWDLRTIRRKLVRMGLDWDLSPYPPALEVDESDPLQVQVKLGSLTPLPPDQKLLTQRAIERYRRALVENPNCPRACNNLAWTYLTAPKALRDWKSALPLAQKAMQLNPIPAHRNTLGLAYYRAGRYREAVEVLQANQKDQVDWALAYDLYFLAMSHYQLGESARARQFYDLAVRWSGTHKEALAPHLVELNAIHGEAAGLLEVKKKKD
jgi:tetratricopeptide (TPR) repeat protein